MRFLKIQNKNRNEEDEAKQKMKKKKTEIINMAKLIMDSYRPDVATYSRFLRQFLHPKTRKNTNKTKQKIRENIFIKSN